MVGAAPLLGAPLVRDQAVGSPAVGLEAFRDGLRRDGDALFEICAASGLADFNALDVPVAVAHLPAQTVVRHRVQALLPVAHQVHGVVWLSRPQRRVVLGRRAGVGRGVHAEVRRGQRAVPVRDNPLLDSGHAIPPSPGSSRSRRFASALYREAPGMRGKGSLRCSQLPLR